MPEPVSPVLPAATSMETTTGSTLAAMAAYDSGVPEDADTGWVLAPNVEAATGVDAEPPSDPRVAPTAPPVPPAIRTRAVRPAAILRRPAERCTGTAGWITDCPARACSACS